MEKLQNKIKNLIKTFSKKEFTFDFLFIYINSKATIKRLRDGDKNQLKTKG
jgi:hypothetical protein